MAQVVQEAHGVASRAALVAAELGDASEDSTGGLESAAPLSLLTDRTSQALLRPLYCIYARYRKVMHVFSVHLSFHLELCVLSSNSAARNVSELRRYNATSLLHTVALATHGGP